MCRDDILQRLRAEGPLPARELPDTCVVPWRSSGWNSGKNVLMLLQCLERRGEVAVSSARAASGSGTSPSGCCPTTRRCPRQEAAAERDRRRLVSLGIARATATRMPGGEPNDVADAGEPAVVEGVRGTWRVDPEQLEALDRPFRGRTALLSPLDRLVFDRKRMTELFAFDYQLEMYKPAAARRWGYWAMPVLHGDRLVGKLGPPRPGGRGGGGPRGARGPAGGPPRARGRRPRGPPARRAGRPRGPGRPGPGASPGGGDPGGKPPPPGEAPRVRPLGGRVRGGDPPPPAGAPRQTTLAERNNANSGGLARTSSSRPPAASARSRASDRPSPLPEEDTERSKMCGAMAAGTPSPASATSMTTDGRPGGPRSRPCRARGVREFSRSVVRICARATGVARTPSPARR